MTEYQNKLIPYHVKSAKLHGTTYGEVLNKAKDVFHEIESRTKRRTYVRSAYFNKQKVFFDYFWQHMFQKKPKERLKRLRYLAAAIEVIQYSRNKPSIKPNPNMPKELLYRFAGVVKGEEFIVQIKEDTRTGRKYLMSCFSFK